MNQTPAEIDGALYALMREEQSLVNRLAQRQHAIENWTNGTMARYYADTIKEYEAEVEALHEQIEKMAAQKYPYTAEYVRRGGWTRAWLVTNGNGHVHKEMECSTCYPTTEFFWLTEVSGKSEEEIVDLAGERACTICYPSAPVEKLSQPTRLFSDEEKSKAERKAERERKATEKEAKRIANSLTEDGSPIVVKAFGWDEKLTHQKTAMTWLTDHLAFYPDSVSDEDVNRVVTALATKRGLSVEEMRAEVDKKAAQKRR